jgi:hypothetical protein
VFVAHFLERALELVRGCRQLEFRRAEPFARVLELGAQGLIPITGVLQFVLQGFGLRADDTHEALGELGALGSRPRLQR